MRVTLALVLVVAACGDDPAMMSGPDAGDDPTVDGSTIDPDAPMQPGDPTADELRAAIASCDMSIGGDYAKDEGGTQNIPICGLTGAAFWKADLDVDCDGQTSAQCNINTDPSYLDETAAVDSMGNPLDAATLPFVVIPLKSARFDYTANGLHLGSVVAVVYQQKVEYGVLGDLGPSSIIGEASYRMAELLGIDPDPSTGGVDSGVAYIAFTGASAEVMTMEDHAEARMIGIAHAKTLLGR